MMVRSILLASLGLILAGCSQEAAPAPGAPVVEVSDAICRPTPLGRQVSGCYLTVTASGDDTLLSVASPAGALAQIHSTRMENNMMVMYELKQGLPLPAGQAVTLAPGGDHIMLLGVREPLVTGDTVPLTLAFAQAGPVEVEASVGQPRLPGS